ncbi:MAG TPA: hypothetical protein VGR53_02945 [Nitrososphaerales archaeon]|nr:hypothetical protein [Nitrososphaerales archaeon]
MIPQFDVPTIVDVDLDLIHLPPKGIIHVKDGLMSNHFYSYLGPIGWKRFEEAFRAEGQALDSIASRATTHDEFEQIAGEVEEVLRFEEFDDSDGLDLGIISPVFALYAFKCFPFTSCRGHPGHVGDTEDCPKVVFFAPPERGPQLVQAAIKTGVGLVNDTTPEGTALLVNSRNLLDMRTFSMELHRTAQSLSRRKPQLELDG